MDSEILKKYTRLNKYYPIKKVFKYFNILQETGIINMYGGAPFLYMGKAMIKHEYTYKHIPDEDAFEELLENADDIRQKLIYGAYKQVHDDDNSGDDRFVRGVERKIQKDAQELLIVWSHFKGKVINENDTRGKSWKLEEKPGLWSKIKRGANNNKIKNYLLRRVPKDTFENILLDNIEFAKNEFDPDYSIYDFHNGFVNIILEDLVNYGYIDVFDIEDINKREMTYNDLHQFLYDLLFETSEKVYAELEREWNDDED